MRSIGDGLAMLLAGEPPLVARDQAPGRVDTVTDGEPDAGIAGIEDRVRNMRPVGEVKAEHLFIRHEVRAHEPNDRLAAVPRHRHDEAHQTGLGRHVVLPAHPNDRVTKLHHQAVAELLGPSWVERTFRQIELVQHPLAAAVYDFVKNRAVALGGILRHENIEIGRKLNAVPAVGQRETDV